ncbi:hypothetical protein B0H11DRAFT_2244565 [Mycena galericulata]|nr:hypothetical protein B0H11DRAFT_2244565 [Mycena galericulata]
MAGSQILTAAEIAAGTCPICQQHLSAPETSTGFQTPENAGRKFQTCPGNNFQASPYHTVSWAWLCDNVHCKAPKHSKSSTPAPLPRLARREYAQAISPDYAAKISQNNAAQTESGARAVEKNDMHTEIQQKLTVFWFLSDDKPPEEYEVACTTRPFWHPKNDKTIIKMVGAENCETYGYHNGTSWKITSLPQELKPGTTTIHLRSPHVRNCDFGQQSPFIETSPRKRHGSMISVEDSPTKRPRHIGSSSSDVYDDFDRRSPNRDSLPPSSPPPPSSPILGPFTAPVTPLLSLADAPPGSRKPWPLMYACDMAAGFRKVISLQGTGAPDGTHFKTDTAFQVAFPDHRYYSSTYNDNMRVWVWARDQVFPLKKAVDAGRTQAGRWSELRSLYNKRPQ